MAHITLSQLRTVLGRIVTWATSKFAARNATSGKLEYADMPVVVLASMGAELDGTGTDRPMSPGSTYFLPAGGGVGARIMFMDSQGVPTKISDPVSSVIYCNAYTGLLYRWDTAQAKMIPVGGTSGGSIDVSGKADLLTGTNMLSPSQWPKVVLRNVTDDEVASLVEGDVFFDSGNLWYRGASGSTKIGTPSKQAIYYCLADGKMYHWNGNSFEVVSLSVEDGRLLRLKTTVVVDEIKANASYDSLPSGKTEYIYYRAGDSKLVRMYISGGSTVTEVYDPDPRVAYFNKDKGKFMYYFNGRFRNALAIDDEPTEDSSNPVSSGGVYTALAAKQDTLVAGNGIVIAQDGKTVSVQESIRTGAGKGATAVQSVSVNNNPVTPDGNGNVNIEVQTGGETVVINAEGANIVDSHTNNSVLLAPSVRQMHIMYENFMELYNKLGNYAFPLGKPQLNWIGTFIQYTLSYGTLSGCQADVTAGLVNEGALRITLTPTNASMVFTSVTVNNVAHSWTPSGESDGSIYLDIVVNDDITVSATATAGYQVSLGSGSSNVTLYGSSALPNSTYQGRIDADANFDRPASITATMNGNAVDFTASGNSYSQQTGEIVIANVTGDIVITAQAVEQAHLTLTLPNDANIICKHGTEVLSTTKTVYSGMMPYAVTIEPAEGFHFTNVPSVGGTALPNSGEIYTLNIPAGSTNDITVTASVASANPLFSGVRYGEGTSVGSLNYLYVGEYESWAISPLINVKNINTIKFATGGNALTFAGLVTFDANKKPITRAGTSATEPRTLTRTTDAGFPTGTKYVRLQMPVSVLSAENPVVYVKDGDDNDLWRLSDYSGSVATPDDFLASEYNPYPVQSDGSWLGWYRIQPNIGWGGQLNNLASNGNYSYNTTMVTRPGKSGETPLALGLSPKIQATPTVSVKYAGEVTSSTSNPAQGSLCVHLSSGKADLFMQTQTPRTSSVSKAGTTHVQLMFRAVVTNGVYSVSTATYVDVGNDGNYEWEFVNPSNNE